MYLKLQLALLLSLALVFNHFILCAIYRNEDA